MRVCVHACVCMCVACWTASHEETVHIQAERAAWSFVKEHPALQLVALCCGFVAGPVLCVDATATAMTPVAHLLDGSLRAPPHLELDVVDVRDVASAHVTALTHPAAADERFLVVNEPLWYDTDIAPIVRDAVPAVRRA